MPRTIRRTTLASATRWLAAPLGVALAVALLSATALEASRERPPLPAEAPGVAPLAPIGAHDVWVPDRMLQHSLLCDGDTGRVRGMIDSPSLLTPKTPLLSRERNEIYSVDVAHSRGTRGERIDFVTIWDATTLTYVDEIVIPTRVATSNASIHYADLIGDRFLGVFSQMPVPSVSIVDLEERRFVETVPVAGCSGLYPAGPRRFASLCGDGTAVAVTLGADGRRASIARSERFFDSVEDPVFMAAARDGNGWVFVSFAGKAQRVDFAGDEPRVEESWSLLGPAEQRWGWAPGGLQHVALHEKSGRLYVAMHEGTPGSHKSPGSQIWVYDTAEHERVAVFDTPNLTAAFIGGFAGLRADDWSYWLLTLVLPGGGAHAIAVSQDDAPLLFVRNAMLGAVGVLDARSGRELRTIGDVGLAGPTLRVPR